jgi:hypothetical protein
VRTTETHFCAKDDRTIECDQDHAIRADFNQQLLSSLGHLISNSISISGWIESGLPCSGVISLSESLIPVKIASAELTAMTLRAPVTESPSDVGSHGTVISGAAIGAIIAGLCVLLFLCGLILVLVRRHSTQTTSPDLPEYEIDEDDAVPEWDLSKWEEEPALEEIEFENPTTVSGQLEDDFGEGNFDRESVWSDGSSPD